MQTTIQEVTQAVAILRPYLSAAQLAVMGAACRGEEGDWFRQRLIDLQEEIEHMPACRAPAAPGFRW